MWGLAFVWLAVTQTLPSQGQMVLGGAWFLGVFLVRAWVLPSYVRVTYRNNWTKLLACPPQIS
jgi:hypothetical protein